MADTSGFEIEVNRARLFDTDRSEMRLRARLDILFPYAGATGAVTKASGVPA